MGKVRCISSDILMNDNFMSLPNSAKTLYVYFNLETDNLGFVDNMSSIMAMLKAKPKDLELLIEREYIIKVKDWLYLETHFWINNKNLRPERGAKSRFKKYLDEYTEDERGIYVVKMPTIYRQNADNLPTICHKNSEENKIKENKIKENKSINNKEDLRLYLHG